MKEGNMKFVTREKVGVERVACPWLVKKFIDPAAEFLFVPEEQVLEVAKKENAISFDAHGKGELDHKDGKCSFEAFLQRYNLTDPALKEMAKIIHAADIVADRDSAPEAIGFLAIIKGLQLLYSVDQDRLRTQFPVYDALYAYCQSKAAA